MTVITMSHKELSRLQILIGLTDGRTRVEDAAALMGLGRRQDRFRALSEAKGAIDEQITVGCCSPSYRVQLTTLPRQVLSMRSESMCWTRTAVTSAAARRLNTDPQLLRTCSTCFMGLGRDAV
jgi:hypothetical protein